MQLHNFNSGPSILPLSKTRKLPKNINAAEAMKYAISGGVTTVDELTSNKEADSKIN